MNERETESIIAETLAFAAAMNAGDAALAASFYAEDGVRVGGFGDVQRGRPEIEVAYNRLLQHTMPGAHLEQERGTVRMLTSELAVWQGSRSSAEENIVNEDLTFRGVDPLRVDGLSGLAPHHQTPVALGVLPSASGLGAQEELPLFIGDGRRPLPFHPKGGEVPEPVHPGMHLVEFHRHPDVHRFPRTPEDRPRDETRTPGSTLRLAHPGY